MAIELTIPSPEFPFCDFCSSPHVVKDYDCPDYVIKDSWSSPTQPKVDLGSKGKWAACAICADLIDRHQGEALMERSLTTFYEQHPEVKYSSLMRIEIRNFLFDLHSQFWRLKSP